MLSNAIDFRNRRKVHRPKSADCERGSSSISEHPAGGIRIKCYYGGPLINCVLFLLSHFFVQFSALTCTDFNQFLTNHLISSILYIIFLKVQTLMFIHFYDCSSVSSTIKLFKFLLNYIFCMVYENSQQQISVR